MSTVDPAEVRRQRQQAKVGNRRTLVWLFIADLVVCGAAALMVRAMYGFSTMTQTSGPPLAVVIGLPTGILGNLVGTFAHFAALRSYTGRLMGGTPFLGLLPLTAIGAAGGAWWGWRVTGSGSIIVPVALSGLAAIILGLAAARRAARRTRLRTLADVMQTGKVAAAVITEIPEIDASSGGAVGLVTVKFTDPSGTDRWVSKLGQWRRADLPKRDDPASVLYDPRDPSDQARMWIGPPNQQHPADFVCY